VLDSTSQDAGGRSTRRGWERQGTRRGQATQIFFKKITLLNRNLTKIAQRFKILRVG
jgi:hypothetical protein